MNVLSKSLIALALTAGIPASAALAQQQPTGVWIDHTGRGAVEIAECAGGLCGHVVWVKDAKNAKACRTQIIGNVKAVGPGTWDRGWIVDPDDNSRYSVELKPIGNDRLRVVGYMGSKLFSETMTWKRAPADLKRCDEKEAAAPSGPVAALPPISARPAELPAAPRVTTIETPRLQPVAPPVREAAVPADVPPARVEMPAEPPTAAPEPRVAEADPAAEPPRRGQRKSTAKRSASRECRLDLPYITLKYPCDGF